MSASVCWKLTCDGLVSRPGGSKILICLTPLKPEISADSMGHLTRKGLAFLLYPLLLKHMNGVPGITDKTIAL